MTLLLGLDLGTTNVKAVVTNLDGEILSEHSENVDIFYHCEAVVRQDISNIYEKTLSVLRAVASRVDAGKIQALGISSQGGAMQLLQSDGSACGEVVSWLDRSGAAEDVAFTEKKGSPWFSRRIAQLRSGLAIGQILRLKKESPEWLQPPRKIGFVGDVIASQLCGHWATDATSMGLTLLYNPYKKEYDPDLLSELQIEAEQLPKLLDSRKAAGFLLPQIAQKIGVPEGIPVSVPIHDQYAAALATGTVHCGDVMFGAGTAWVLLAVTDNANIPVLDGAFFCSHVVENLYGQILSLTNGGSAFQWIVDLLGLQSLPQAEMDRVILEAPPGSGGLLFWPFLSPLDVAGVRPGTRGRFDNLELFHSRSHLLRAVLEGLACELYRHLCFVTDSGVVVKRLVMCGKACSSSVTPQMIADVVDLPVLCADHTGTSALGATVLAAGLVQPNEPLHAISERMTSSVREVLPGNDREFYRSLREKYVNSLS